MQLLTTAAITEVWFAYNDTKEVPKMACVKEYMFGNAHIKIMDDDVASPEEQERIMKNLRAIAWEVKRSVARRAAEEERMKHA